MSRLTLLYEVAEQVNSTLELSRCLDRIIDGAYRIFGAEKLSLMLTDDSTNEMWIAAARNIPKGVQAEVRVRIGEGLSGKVALSGEPLVVADVEDDPRLHRKSRDQYRTGSFAIVPLKHKERVLGVINLTNRADDAAFSAEDLALLTALANQAAIAIENSRLVTQLNREKEQINRRAFESRILYQVSSSIRYGLGYQHLIELLSSSLHELLDYDVLCSLLVLNGGEDFETQELHEVPPGYVNGVKHTVLDELGAQPHGAVVSDRIKSLREALPARGDDSRPSSVIAVPLEVNGQAVGLITVTSRREDAFSEEDSVLLRTIVQRMGETVERLQSTIRGEQGKMQAMVASMAEGVIMFDANDELVVLNPKARSMLGLASTDEFTTKSLLKSVLWKNIAAFLAEPAGHEAHAQEFTVDTHPAPTMLAVAVTPVTDERDGQFLGRLAVIRDVTRERELDRMKSDFVAVVSHELRTPIASFKTFTSNLIDGVEGEVNTGQRETLTRITKNLDRLSRLINDLLDLSKLEAGKMKMHLAPLDVRETAQSVVDIFTPGAATKNVAMELTCPDHMPVLWADSDRIIQVLTNLLGNALKFTPEGGTITVGVKHRPPEPEDRISTSGERSPISSEGYIAISVRDTGPGIPEDDLERVFDKFYQTDHSMTRKAGGTGLGLPICREIVNRHGGRIWSESTPGQGATFTFELPGDCRKHDRAQLQDAMEREIRRSIRYDVPFSVLMLDLDNFTVLNEMHGYATGDTALVQLQDMVREEVKKFLKERVRETDIVGRFGGDEFLIIAPETDEDGSRGFAERLRRLIEERDFVVEDETIRATISVGITAFTEEDRSPMPLVRRSAAALAKAKSAGKNTVC